MPVQHPAKPPTKAQQAKVDKLASLGPPVDLPMPMGEALRVALRFVPDDEKDARATLEHMAARM